MPSLPGNRSRMEDPAAPPDWIIDILRTTRYGRVEEHPGGGLVLFARGARLDAEPDLFADDDDLLSATLRRCQEGLSRTGGKKSRNDN